GIYEYRKANGTDCSGATWTSYGGGGSIAHTLTTSQGSQTVCLQVRDLLENTSSTTTDVISFDNVKPDSTVSTNGTIGPNTTSGANTTIAGGSSDTTSGVSSMSISIQQGAG